MRTRPSIVLLALCALAAAAAAQSPSPLIPVCSAHLAVSGTAISCAGSTVSVPMGASIFYAVQLPRGTADGTLAGADEDDNSYDVVAQIANAGAGVDVAVLRGIAAAAVPAGHDFSVSHASAGARTLSVAYTLNLDAGAPDVLVYATGAIASTTGGLATTAAANWTGSHFLFGAFAATGPPSFPHLSPRQAVIPWRVAGRDGTTHWIGSNYQLTPLYADLTGSGTGPLAGTFTAPTGYAAIFLGWPNTVWTPTPTNTAGATPTPKVCWEAGAGAAPRPCSAAAPSPGAGYTPITGAECETKPTPTRTPTPSATPTPSCGGTPVTPLPSFPAAANSAYLTSCGGNQVLASKAPDDERKPLSVAKLLAALVAADWARANPGFCALDPGSPCVLDTDCEPIAFRGQCSGGVLNAAGTYGNVLVPDFTGTNCVPSQAHPASMTLWRALHGTLMLSGNDCINGLGEQVSGMPAATMMQVLRKPLREGGLGWCAADTTVRCTADADCAVVGGVCRPFNLVDKAESLGIPWCHLNGSSFVCSGTADCPTTGGSLIGPPAGNSACIMHTTLHGFDNTTRETAKFLNIIANAVDNDPILRVVARTATYEDYVYNGVVHTIESDVGHSQNCFWLSSWPYGCWGKGGSDGSAHLCHAFAVRCPDASGPAVIMTLLSDQTSATCSTIKADFRAAFVSLGFPCP